MEHKKLWALTCTNELYESFDYELREAFRSEKVFWDDWDEFKEDAQFRELYKTYKTAKANMDEYRRAKRERGYDKES